MVDIKTKAIKLELVDVTIMAKGIAIMMKNRVFREEGLPAKVISDREPQFVSRFMKELYSLLRVEGNPSTAYHPQMDGQTERMNREVKKFLRMFTNFQQDDWADWLPLAEFTYDHAINESTGQTPFT
jgi:transposase InsO family protein